MKSLVDTIKELQAINEMAIGIGEYKEKIAGISVSLISHICLLFYSKLYLNGEYYTHWLGEASGFAKTIVRYTLSAGNINKAIRQLWLANNYNISDGVLKICSKKFKEEHINKEIQSILSGLFTSHFDDFIDILKSENKEKMRQEIEKFVFNIVKNSSVYV